MQIALSTEVVISIDGDSSNLFTSIHEVETIKPERQNFLVDVPVLSVEHFPSSWIGHQTPAFQEDPPATPIAEQLSQVTN